VASPCMWIGARMSPLDDIDDINLNGERATMYSLQLRKIETVKNLLYPNRTSHSIERVKPSSHQERLSFVPPPSFSHLSTFIFNTMSGDELILRSDLYERQHAVWCDKINNPATEKSVPKPTLLF